MIASDTYTIFWRELKRYRKSKTGVLIRLIQPAVWIIVIGNTFAGTQPLIESVGFAGEYIEFMTPGVMILTAIFTSIFGGVNTLWDRRYGFMNKALTSPISRSSIALGKMLAISLIAALQATLILGIALAIGVSFPNPILIIPIMVTVILFSLGFSGISVMVAATAKSQETFWGLINFLGMPLFMNKALTSPISRSSIALGKMLAISLIAALQATLILGIALAIGVSFPNPILIIPIMVTVILFSLGFSGISVMVAATAKSQETFWGLINFLGMPLFMISPALFPLDLLPEWLAFAAKFNPVTYAVLLMREMMTGVNEGVNSVLAIGIIVVFVMVMIGLASYVFTREVNKPF